MARPLAVIGLTFFTALWVFGNTGEGVAIVCAVLFAALSIVSLSVRRVRTCIVWPCAFVALLAASVSFITYSRSSVYPVRQLDGKTVTVTAHLIDLPQEQGDFIQYTVRTDTVNGKPLSFPMVVNAPKGKVKLSDVLVFRNVLHTKYKVKKVYLYKTGLQTIPHKETLTSRMLRFRQYTKDTILGFAEDDRGAILNALLTGDKDAISAPVLSNMRSCGVMHMFAVSGFHLSVFSFVLFSLLNKLKIHRILSAVISSVPVVFLMLMTGSPKSAVRSAIMLLLFFFGKCFFRETDGLNSLGLAVLLIGLADPSSATDTGLLLSVLGVMTLILSAPLQQWITKRVPTQILQTVVSAMMISALVNIVILPICILEFGYISMVAPVVNACLMAAAEWAMILSALGVLFSLSPALLFLQERIFILARALSNYCLRMFHFFGKMRFSVLNIPRDTAIVWVAGVLVLISAAILLHMPRRRKVILTVSLAVVSLAVSASFYAYSERGNATITVVDQGNATGILVRSDGHTALIGSMKPYQLQRYVSHLDMLLAPRKQATEITNAFQDERHVPTDRTVIPERCVQTLPLYFFSELIVTSSYSCSVGQVEVEYVHVEDEAAVRLTVHGKRMLLLFSPGTQIQKLPPYILASDILYTRMDLPMGISADHYALQIVSCDEARSETLPRSDSLLCTGGRGDIHLTVSREGLIRIERGS